MTQRNESGRRVADIKNLLLASPVSGEDEIRLFCKLFVELVQPVKSKKAESKYRISFSKFADEWNKVVVSSGNQNLKFKNSCILKDFKDELDMNLKARFLMERNKEKGKVFREHLKQNASHAKFVEPIALNDKFSRTLDDIIVLDDSEVIIPDVEPMLIEPLNVATFFAPTPFAEDSTNMVDVQSTSATNSINHFATQLTNHGARADQHIPFQLMLILSDPSVQQVCAVCQGVKRKNNSWTLGHGNSGFCGILNRAATVEDQKEIKRFKSLLRRQNEKLTK